MKKLKKFFNEDVDWNEVYISMGIFLGFFTIIAITMVSTGTWKIFSLPVVLFYLIGFIISLIINLFKQIK